jgi:hypothetical protein
LGRSLRNLRPADTTVKRKLQYSQSHFFLLLNLTSTMRKGTKVTWKYGTGTATGKIESVHKEPIARTIKGSEIHRNGSDDDPALVIVQENGDRVIKLKSEVKAAK